MKTNQICQKLKFFLLIPLFLLSSYSFSSDGAAGYYWHSSTPGLVGSTSHEAAMMDCNKFEDCTGVSMVASGTYSNGMLYIDYKRILSSGMLSIVSNRFFRMACKASTSDIASCQEGYQPPVDMCSDGFPPNVYGYEDHCDRPTPKQCSDGTYVKAGGYCSVSVGVCSDYDSCYQYAMSKASCSKTSASVLTFNYRDPTSFDFACETIDPSSPDNPSNGGNADGNEYNDPQSPESTSSGNSDLTSLATAIGKELRGDFGNIERAVRDGTTAANANTDKTIDAINTAQNDLNNTLTDIKSAIQDGNNTDNGSEAITDSINTSSSKITSAISNSSNDISGSVNDLNQTVASGDSVISGQLSDISSKLENLKPCDPNTDAKSCEGEHGISSSFITNVMDTLQNLFNDENEKAVTSIKGEVTSIQGSSPLDSSVLDGLFDPILSIIPQPRECSPIIFAPSKPYSFTISCEFSDKFKSIFGFLIAIYTIQSLIGIVLSTASPKSQGA